MAEDKSQDAAQSGEARKVEVDESGAAVAYANFFRLTGTPDEVILDFGLNAHPYQETSEPIAVTQRTVMNYYTAKRMLHALHMSVQRHEQAFGIIETNVQKRVLDEKSDK